MATHTQKCAWAVVLACTLVHVSGRRGAAPVKLEPPPVAEQVQWLKPRAGKRVNKRGEIQTVTVTYGGYNERFTRIDQDGNVKHLPHSTVHTRKMPRARKNVEQWSYRIVIPIWRGIAWYAWKTGMIEVHPTINEKGERDLLAVPAGFYEKPLFGRRTREQIRLEQLRRAERKAEVELAMVNEHVAKANTVKDMFDDEMKRREEERAAKVKRAELNSEKAFEELQADCRIASAFQRRVVLSEERLTDAQSALQTIKGQLNAIEDKGPSAAQIAAERRAAEFVSTRIDPETEQRAMEEYDRAMAKKIAKSARGKRAPLSTQELEGKLQRLGRGRK